MEATGRGLIAFWDWASGKGLMNKNTAGGLKAACKEVLSAVDGESWEETQLHEVDPDDYGSRFERLRAANFKPQSLVVYKSRFKNGLSMYLAYLENPSGWRYTAERPAAARRKAGASAPPAAANGQVQHQSGARGEMLQYPYPLRPGLVVQITLPTDLTKGEAKRLAAYLDSLAFEEVRMLPPAPQPVSE